MAELWQLGAEEASRRVRSGELGAEELVLACLERTARVEPAVGAFLEVDGDGALERARELDARRRRGESLGELAGVPVALKDNLSLRGRALRCASRILEGYRSPYTATAVERLLAADAVVVGRTNMDEFAMGSSCENSAFQVTSNPWDGQMVPGGSSGGSAAAVAAGSVPLGLGSDTGGSIRQPAAFCGVVGLKPTYGRVSRYGLVAFASSLDQIGPVTRSVRDAALALRALAGGDPRDSTCADRPVEDYLAEIESGIEGLRIGVIDEIDTDSLAEDVSRDWRRSISRFEELGADLVHVSVPNVTAAVAVYYVIANCEASANLARFDGLRYGRRDETGRSLVDMYSGSREEGFGAEVKRRIMLGTFALSSGYYDAYYGRARGVLQAMREQFAAAFDRADVLMAPSTPAGAFPRGERVDDPLAMYLSDVFTTPASLVGLPALSVPSGCDDRGLPLSLQLMGRPFAEADLLRAARAFESATEWSIEPAFARVEGEAGGGTLRGTE
jgi:aspartyl-tRNA(Asn)/glutamyl-tRNA(Gln) amidotransferase subunit A